MVRAKIMEQFETASITAKWASPDRAYLTVLATGSKNAVVHLDRQTLEFLKRQIDGLLLQ